jgi:hypothetical protein
MRYVDGVCLVDFVWFTFWQYYEATKDMVPVGASPEVIADAFADAKQTHMNHISRHRAAASVCPSIEIAS